MLGGKIEKISAEKKTNVYSNICPFEGILSWQNI